ncbi:dTDP-4-dehydrorhamnose reductase [uncultured Dialister sp.]|jgi:dTDP-4-dehydrorhamnose reductase|uniref:dTDP-4-dehydrorhamnose reductase n=1 Tax=uncultured Dialister sp. TaxID=278064 RepID=UPI0025F9C0CD|nr:dTDP-4-dehydrorhamnose reductase [uncultured Dialister sp.]
MKVLVTGVTGQLGYDVARELEKRHIEYKGTGSREMDISDTAAVERVIKDYHPDAIIHCAAYTAVDKAEDDYGRAMDVNAKGTLAIAKAAKEIDAKMLYISTDYVFNGQGTEPFTVDAATAPLNVYGLTKLFGEEAVRMELSKYFIVRISWVFGKNGNNFIKTMLRLGQTHEELTVVSDQWGSPTYTADLAPLLCDMMNTDAYGIYHATNEGGYISWYDFACEIFRQAGYTTKVIPVTTAEYGLSKAKRPFNSRLDKSKLVENGFTPLPDWKDALKRYLEELGARG